MAIDTNSTNSTNVILIGAKNNVFKDIIDAITGLRGQVEDNGIANNNDSRGRRDQENANEHRRLAVSVAAERKQRAAANAINGKIDKAMSTMDVFKKMVSSAFETLGDLVKDGFKQSLKSYDDFAKSMREINISHDDKLAAQSAADRANIVDGFRVSKDSVTKVLTFVAKSNNAYFQKLVNSNNEESKLRMNIMGEMSEQGYDEDTILKVMTNTSDRQLSQLQGLILKTSDASVRAASIEMIRSTINDDFESISTDVVGGLTGMVDATRKMAATGANLSDKTVISLAKLAQDMKSGQLQNVDVSSLSAALGIVGDQIKNPDVLFSSLSSKLIELNNLSKEDSVASKKQSDLLIKNLIPLLKASEVDKGVIQDVSRSINQAGIGQLADVQLKTIEQLEENDKDNTPDGKLNNFIGDLTSKFNVFTEDTFGIKGGLFGNIATNLDEIFGGDMGINEVVKAGFNATADLLGSIHTTQLIQGAANLLGGKGILSKIGPLLKSGLTLVVKALPFALASGSVALAATTISDVIKKSKRIDDASESIRSNKKEETVARDALAAAKKYGTKEDQAKAEAKLASVLEAGKSARAEEEAAVEASKTGSEKNSEKYSEEQRAKRSGLIDQANMTLRMAYKAKAAGDTETANKLFNERTEIQKQITDTFENARKVREASHGLVANLASSFHDAANKVGLKIDLNLEPETMLEWQNFCDSLYDFFTKDLPGFFTDTIPDAFSSLGGFIYDSVSNLISSVSNWISTRIIKPVVNFKNYMGSWLSDNVINPVINFKDYMGSWLSDNVINPINDFTTSFSDMLNSSIINPINGFMNSLSDMTLSLSSFVSDIVDKLPDWIVDKFSKDDKKMANGGIVNSATRMIAGEAGKEAILPITRENSMRKVLSELSFYEKSKLLKSLLASSGDITIDLISKLLHVDSTNATQLYSRSIPQQYIKNQPTNNTTVNSVSSGVPGDDPATINKILGYAGNARDLVYNRMLHGWKGNYKDGFKQREKWYDEAKQNASNQTGRELIAGTYAEKALDFGVSELGKPYILRSLGKLGYVCNELVNACLQASGFDMQKFRVHGVGATFANIAKGKHSDGKGYPDFRIRTDLTPQTATPGMIFFQDSKKDREGFQPGHIGFVYYGNQKLHSAGGSANYTKEGFLQNWQTPCRGVTVTPFDNNKYVIGELPGLFEQTNGTFGQTTSSQTLAKNVGLLTNEEINSLAKEAGLQNASAMTEFVKQAEILLNSNTNTDKNSVIAILMEIAKCLKGSVASKQPMMSVARNVTSVYGQ